MFNMRNLLGICYILCMCVCVGASSSTIASDNPSSSALYVVCVERFLGGSQGGSSMAPPGYVQRSAMGSSSGQRPKFFLGRFFLFLAVF
jgi:hypothetical protein